MAEDIRTMADTTGVAAFHHQFEKPYCVLLDSEYCSMGRMIGAKACEKAGYTYYDAVILLDLLNDPEVNVEFMEKVERQLRNKHLSREEILSIDGYEKLTKAFDKAIDMALAKGPCLIHDRAIKEDIVKRGYSVFTVLNYATDINTKIERAKLSTSNNDCHTEEEYITRIQEEDNIRYNSHLAKSDTTWGDKATYDLCLNAETLGRDYAGEVLASILNGR